MRRVSPFTTAEPTWIRRGHGIAGSPAPPGASASHSHPRASRVNISWPCSRGGRSPGSIGCGSSDIFVRLPGPELQRFLCDHARVAVLEPAKFMSRWFWSFFWCRVFVGRLQHASGRSSSPPSKNQLENVPACDAMALSGRMLRSPYQRRINVPNTHLHPS